MKYGTLFTFGRDIWTALVTVRFRVFGRSRAHSQIMEFQFPFIRHVYKVFPRELSSTDKDLYDMYSRLENVGEDLLDYYRAFDKLMTTMNTDMNRFFNNYMIPGLGLLDVALEADRLDETREVDEEARRVGTALTSEAMTHGLGDLDDISLDLSEEGESESPMMLDTFQTDVDNPATVSAIDTEEAGIAVSTGINLDDMILEEELFMTDPTVVQDVIKNALRHFVRNHVVVIATSRKWLETRFSSLAFNVQVKVGNRMFTEFVQSLVSSPTSLSSRELGFLKIAANYSNLGDLSKYHITTATLITLSGDPKYFTKATVTDEDMLDPSDIE